MRLREEMPGFKVTVMMGKLSHLYEGLGLCLYVSWNALVPARVDVSGCNNVISRGDKFKVSLLKTSAIKQIHIHFA